MTEFGHVIGWNCSDAFELADFYPIAIAVADFYGGAVAMLAAEELGSVAMSVGMTLSAESSLDSLSIAESLLIAVFEFHRDAGLLSAAKFAVARYKIDPGSFLLAAVNDLVADLVQNDQ